MNQNEKRTAFLVNTFYYAVIITIVLLFIKYLLSPLLPFITAFIIAAMSRKIILRLEDSCHSKKFASVTFTVLLVLILSFIIYGIFFGLLKELRSLADSFSAEALTVFFDTFSEKANIFLDKLSSLPFFDTILKKFSFTRDGFDKILSALSGTVLPSIVSWIMKFISFFPSAVIFICFMFISVFYFSYDYERICRFLMMQLPEKLLDTFDATKSVITSTAKELFKSYFLLTFITFLQLLIGFSIIGTGYSLLLASIISIIDLLPILGTGTILIPWSLICFILNDSRSAIGLVVLYAVITLFRQVAQPKIIGSGAGLSPLVSLISIFAGLKLMGFFGIIIFPIITATLIKLNEKGFIRLYKNFPPKSGSELIKTRTKFLNFKRSDSQRSDSKEE